MKSLEDMTVEELFAEMRSLSQSVARNVRRMALVIAELDRRGEDVRSLQISYPEYLRRIAAGTLTAEAFVAFVDRPNLLRAVSAQPIEEQLQLVAKGIPHGEGDRFIAEHQSTRPSRTYRKRVDIESQANALAEAIRATRTLTTTQQAALTTLSQVIKDRLGKGAGELTKADQTVRREIARYLSAFGRFTPSTLASELGYPLETIQSVIHHPWFEIQGQLVSLTNKGRKETGD